VVFSVYVKFLKTLQKGNDYFNGSYNISLCLSNRSTIGYLRNILRRGDIKSIILKVDWPIHVHNLSSSMLDAQPLT
jgi:hypothetical protein